MNTTEFNEVRFNSDINEMFYSVLKKVEIKINASINNELHGLEREGMIKSAGDIANCVSAYAQKIIQEELKKK